MAQNTARNTDRGLGKVFSDSIHGHVELHPLLVKIIDTPQFQRLRYIKQLGGGYFVYPGASHNRFEHSIGVAHLAGVLAKTLRENQPELNITDEDILCLQIAGLCHDLGHGPFSHLFDQMFMPQACENEEWKHEIASVEMFEHLVEVNNLTPVMKKYKLKIEKDQDNLKPEMEKYGLNDDRVFIKELILGEPLDKKSYKGREEGKSFLYEIVSNKQNGIDVDKFDYFARDCHHLGIKNNFDHLRYFKFVRVIEVKTDQSKRKHICSRDKEVGNLYDMFYTRNTLHRRAYQHKVNKNVELMIKDALLKANYLIKFKGKEGKLFTLSDAKNDMEAYTQLTDQVTERILVSDNIKMEQAKKILKRITKRDLYKLVGEAKPLYEGTDRHDKKISKRTVSCFEEKIKSLEDRLKEVLAGAVPNPERDYFEVLPITYSYGKGDNDPVESVYFYKKDKPKKAFTIPRHQVSNFLPECFLEQNIRVYWKNENKTQQDAAAQTFTAWCNENGFQVDIYIPSDNNQPPEDPNPSV